MMLQPSNVPTKIPTHTSAAYTSLAPVHINRVYTPTTNTSRANRYKKCPTKKPTDSTKTSGCLSCQADVG
eukprot:7847329-Ditylum_brightwellii.AAC.1